MTPRLGLWACAALVGAGWLGMRLTSATAAAVALAIGLVAIAATRWGPPARRSATATVAVLLVAAGCAGIRFVHASGGPLVDLADTLDAGEIRAVVVDEPRLTQHGWWSIVRVERIDGARCRARVLLRSGTVTGREPPVLGSVWRGRVTASRLGRDGFDAYLRRRYVSVAIHPLDWEMAQGPGRLAAASEHVRSRIRDTAARGLPGDHAGLAVGLVTGDTRLLADATEDRMRATGLTHLVAVSGSNVALVLVGAGAVLHLLRTPARARRALLGVVLAWFLFLTRWEPSVIRATVMAAVVLLAVARGHLADGRHSLAGAVLLVVLADPGSAASLGLLLSAAAAAGVLIIGPLLRTRLTVLPDRVANLVAPTVAAQIAVAPVLLLGLGEMPLVAVPANLLAVPAAAVAAALATAAAVVSLVHPALGGGIFSLAHAPLSLVLRVAETLS